MGISSIGASFDAPLVNTSVSKEGFHGMVFQQVCFERQACPWSLRGCGRGGSALGFEQVMHPVIAEAGSCQSINGPRLCQSSCSPSGYMAELRCLISCVLDVMCNIDYRIIHFITLHYITLYYKTVSYEISYIVKHIVMLWDFYIVKN